MLSKQVLDNAHTKAYLIAISINLILINTAEVFVDGSLSTSSIADQGL